MKFSAEDLHRDFAAPSLEAPPRTKTNGRGQHQAGGPTGPAYAQLVSRLKQGDGENFHCPGPIHAHGDRNPSLSVTDCDGKVLLNCFAGDSYLDIINAVGMSEAELFDDYYLKFNGRANGASGSQNRGSESDCHSEQENAEEPPRGLDTLTQEEFDEDVAPEALVERLIFRASVTTLNGASKVGKSYFAYQLAMAIASGKPFLGLATTQANVLLVSLELSAGMVRKRMQAISDATGVPMPKIGEYFHVSAPTRKKPLSLNLTQESGRAALVATIREKGAELVILDTLYRFCPGADPNSNAEMGQLFGHFNFLAHETGCALLALDHAAKGALLGPASQSGIGAQAKGGSAATVVSLKSTSREDGGRWSVDVDSWFGSWDDSAYYERPKSHTGGRLEGCVPCGAAEAYGLPVERMRELFRDFGERNADGKAFFASKNALTKALIAAKLATGNNDGPEMIRAIERDHCVPAGSRIAYDKPITMGHGAHNAVSFTWRLRLDPAEAAELP